jgi:D-amino-acid oxidase
MSSKAIVIGAGVIGLSTAVRLLEQGLEVEVWAAQFPPHTTSNIAAAFWMPYAAAPADKVQQWTLDSYQSFLEFSEDPYSGVRAMPTIEVLPAGTSIPDCHQSLPGLRMLSASELPEHLAGGYTFNSFVIDTTKYMPFLCERAEECGAYLVQKQLDSLDEALAKADLVINCAGIGARELVNDREIYAGRGQVVRIAKQDLNQVIGDASQHERPTYIVPRENDCVLGGSFDERQEDLLPQSDLTESIMWRCQELEPRLKMSSPLEVIVGLRPCRKIIRLERQEMPGGKVIIHNYGHGGSGITLSWGCAQEAAKLAHN